MRPYYQDDFVTLYHGDCLDVMPRLSEPFDVVLIDPPYGKVKGEFDEAWRNRPAMLKDAAKWRDLAHAAMTFNGTLWWFAWPSLAGRIESLVAERLNPLAHVVWQKPTPLANKHSPGALRAPAPETERVLMFEHYNADNKALGESGYIAKCDEARGHVFEPLRLYLDGERERAGVSRAEVDRAWQAWKGGKGGMSSHWFGNSQWALPTAANYAWLQQLFNRSSPTSEYLQKDYEYLQKDYEHLRQDYERLRRFFCLTPDDPKTDIWHFSPSGNPHGHPTEKPLPLISFMLRISSRPGATVCDYFAGSGTTGVAAKLLGLRCVLVEKEERYCAIAARRLAQEILPIF